MTQYVTMSWPSRNNHIELGQKKQKKTFAQVPAVRMQWCKRKKSESERGMERLREDTVDFL